jgi:hypothetical protein
MDEHEINSIEDALVLKLPSDYVGVISEYPFGELAKEKYARKALMNEPREIISINIRFRENGYRKNVWPSNYYIIGINDTIVMFMNIGMGDSNIYQIDDENKFNPKNIKPLKFQDSIEEYVDFVEMLQDIYDNPDGSASGDGPYIYTGDD